MSVTMKIQERVTNGWASDSEGHYKALANVPTQSLSQGVALCARILDLLWSKASTYYTHLNPTLTWCTANCSPWLYLFSFRSEQTRVEFDSEMVVEMRPMSSCCLFIHLNQINVHMNHPVSGKTGLSLTKISSSFPSLVFVKLKKMQIKIHSLRYVRMNYTFVPHILKSIQTYKCTGVSPKRITRKSFSRFIRRRFLSLPIGFSLSHF